LAWAVVDGERVVEGACCAATSVGRILARCARRRSETPQLGAAFSHPAPVDGGDGGGDAMGPPYFTAVEPPQQRGRHRPQKHGISSTEQMATIPMMSMNHARTRRVPRFSRHADAAPALS
jgi:hypothetical protein